MPDPRKITEFGAVTELGGDLIVPTVDTSEEEDVDKNKRFTLTLLRTWLKTYFDIAYSGLAQTLTDEATITYDAALGVSAKITLGGDRTLAVPTNATPGMHGALEIIQDGTGGRALTLAAGWQMLDGDMASVALMDADKKALLEWWAFSGSQFPCRLTVPLDSLAFTPLDLVPSLWLDGADASTMYDAITGGSLVAPDGAVYRWEDKSGENNHATRDVNAQPLRKSSYVNGRDAVLFDDSSSQMATTLGITSGEYEIYAVYACASESSTPRRAVVGSSNWLMGPYNGRIEAYAGDFTSGPTFSANIAYIQSARQSGGTLTNRVNGATPTTASHSTFPGTVGLGAYVYVNPLNGPICEVIAVVGRTLADGERTLVETYLANKWGVTL